MRNINKFKEMIHYICHQCKNPQMLGAVKLNKVAWFSDVISFQETGNAISSARYVKQKFGPVPKQILPVLRELQDEGRLRIDEVEYYGNTKRQYVSLSDPDVSIFSETELKTLDSVIDAVCNGHTASTISDLTHDDIWKIAEIGEEIPLHAILASEFSEVTDEDIERVHLRMKKAA